MRTSKLLFSVTAIAECAETRYKFLKVDCASTAGEGEQSAQVSL